jgi:hypothetical protein
VKQHPAQREVRSQYDRQVDAPTLVIDLGLSTLGSALSVPTVTMV